MQRRNNGWGKLGPGQASKIPNILLPSLHRYVSCLSLYRRWSWSDISIPPKSTREVHELLRRLGVEKPKEVSCCHKRAILKGYIVLLPPEDDPCQRGKHNLHKELLIDSCPACGKKLTYIQIFSSKLTIQVKDVALRWPLFSVIPTAQCQSTSQRCAMGKLTLKESGSSIIIALSVLTLGSVWQATWWSTVRSVATTLWDMHVTGVGHLRRMEA